MGYGAENRIKEHTPDKVYVDPHGNTFKEGDTIGVLLRGRDRIGIGTFVGFTKGGAWRIMCYRKDGSTKPYSSANGYYTNLDSLVVALPGVDPTKYRV